ncbi:putative lipid II flippase FtsW [Candidatus Soleaferrea massiliensis]|uniref:putative lipid II flippase FtsW n=1 Tax=Candidatus Soleaferrea massiliensis TaxID=1470354 RepID=UPI00058BBDC3|nr:putative lipid II flippase FtsW [Candidatus Soleaferrea massiliensis]
MDLIFLLLVLALLTFGLIMLFSASYAQGYYRQDGDSFYYIKRQLVFAFIGVAAMIVISFVNYRVLEKLAVPIMALAVVLLIVVLFCPPDENGIRRWIPLGIFSVQPSEIVKFAVILLFAKIIVLKDKHMKEFKHGILPFGIILVLISALMILEPHLSGTIIILMLGCIMMIVGGANLKWFTIAGIAGVIGVFLIIVTGTVQYAGSRVDVWLDPFSDALGDGFQTVQSLYAIGSGGLMGVGLGNSRQKFLYIPEPQNDFIFAIVCEELGFIGAALIIILFALLLWRGFTIAMKAKDKFASLVAAGLTAQVAIQAMLNIAVVTNSIPNTGISLPFFSSGGTSLIMLLAQMGVVLSISRYSNIEKT